MDLVYKGKTKDVYSLSDGIIVLKFKDDLTGTDGIFDPGANTVGLTVEGAGKAGLRLSEFLFRLLNKNGVSTHFIDADIENAIMTVHHAEPIGKGMEVICRYRAVGSFLRRYGLYVEAASHLPAYVEMSLKDDVLGDPMITKDALEILGILNPGEYDEIVDLTRRISGIIKSHLETIGLDLYDIKLEYGRLNGEIILIDELSAGNMRVFQGDTHIQPLDLTERLLG
jgi:phosphoribosylaminoimidazole-succinocarboxamide synthase